MEISIGYIFIGMLYNIQVFSYSALMIYLEICVAWVCIVLFITHTYNYKGAEAIEKIYYLGIDICIIECVIILVVGLLFKNVVVMKNIESSYLILAATFFVAMLIYYANKVDYYVNRITEKNILTQLAYTDCLTGLNNRTKYEEMIKEMDKDNLTIISCDLNNLKKVNDRLGHDVGDMYIKGFASVANNTFKKYGDIYRIGGDEFSILTYMKLEDIQEKLENMTSLFEKEYKEEEFGVKASFAYGYANSKEDNVSNIEALVKIADERMYELKSEQKKRMKGKANI